MARIVNALFQSPQWRRAALFLTYDEHGGFWDHVPPPPACVPDNIPPMLEPGDTGRSTATGFASRSSWSRRTRGEHYVSHKVYDLTSILRFIETRFDLPALTRRDANADPLLRLFKFSKPSFVVPPALPAAPIDQAHHDSDACVNAPPPTGL